MPTDLEALDLVPEAVVVLDANGIVRYANTRAHQLLGFVPPEGADFFEAVTLEDDSGNVCGTAMLQVGDSADRLAERILHVALPDGRHRPVAVSGRVLDDSVCLTFRNAGRRQRLDRARSDLVATVSHEIRSPLTSVKGFTRTLLAKWDRFSDDQKRTMLETINEDADRVTRLLAELLDVSRIDAGRVQLHRQMVGVEEVVARVVDKARHRPEGVDRHIDCDVDGELPRIHADPDKLEQILTNLIENALSYAPDSEIRVRVRNEDEAVHLVVEDDGPGISEDQRRHIFEKFGRGRANRRSGTGLGLYITRGLAEAHGGEVWCQSEKGEGAAFHVRLPVGGLERPEVG